jgi:hypothetical protein
MMHPAMAVWIWSLTMGRAWQSSLWEPFGVSNGGNEHAPPNVHRAPKPSETRPVFANGYLHSEIPGTPLPDKLLDRLAELYWTERDSELAI